MSNRMHIAILMANEFIKDLHAANKRTPTDYAFSQSGILFYWDHPKPEEARSNQEKRISFCFPPDYLQTPEFRASLITQITQQISTMQQSGYADYLTEPNKPAEPALWSEGKRPINSDYESYLSHVYTTGVVKKDRTGTGTKSIFGHQMRFDLSEGFPLVTTKKVHMKSIIVELLWFLRGDTNTKFLKDNGVTIWNEWEREGGDLGPIYGSQWRNWEDRRIVPFSEVEAASAKGYEFAENVHCGGDSEKTVMVRRIDQISEVINTLKTNPDSRRIIVSAWNVADLDRMALPPCHAFFQFYTEELPEMERLLISKNMGIDGTVSLEGEDIGDTLTRYGVPARRLSCQLYQR